MMKPLFLFRCLLPVLCGWFLLTSLPAPASEQDTITEALRKEDSRLQTRVSLTVSRIYIGDLIERLAVQSHVALTCGIQDTASDDPICVRLQDTPLADVLDSLWSLVSYQKAEWRWERRGEAGAYSYHLSRPLVSRRFADYLKEQIQLEFEALCEDMLKASLLTPDARKKFLMEFVPKRLGGDMKLVEAYTSPVTDRTWGGLRIFQEAFPKEQWKRVLRGEEDPHVPVSSLSAFGKEWVHKDWLASPTTRINLDGTQELLPEVDKIGFAAERADLGVTPVLFLTTYSGLGYIGGTPFEKVIQAKLRSLWYLENDLTTEEREKRKLERPQGLPEPPRNGFPMEDRLLQMAEAAQVSLLARLPVDPRIGNQDLGSPFGQSLESYLSRLQKHDVVPLPHKWRNSLLMVNYPPWFYEEDQKASWSVIKQLRATRLRDGGLTPLRDLGIAIARLNAKQIPPLEKEFPILAQTRGQPALISLFGREPLLLHQILTTQGTLLSDALAKMPPNSLRGLEGEVTAGARLRIRSVISSFGKEYYLECNREGNWKMVGNSTMMVDAGRTR